MTICSMAASDPLQSVIQAQSAGRIGHRCHDHQGVDSSGSAATTDAAPVLGGFMMDLLESLQNMLSAQTSAAGGSTAAASTTAATDASAVTDTSAVTSPGTASDTTTAGAQNVAATTAKDFATFLQALFQAARAANAISTGIAASSDSGTATTVDTTTAFASAVATATATTAAATTAAATNTTTTATATDATTAVSATPTSANPSPVGSDGGNSTHAGGHHRHHGMGAYRSNLVSGLQSVLQQLKSTDGGAGAADLSSFNSAYSTLMQDLSGAQGSSAVASSTTGSAGLQGFLTDLIGGLQSRGNTAPPTTGSIISVSA